MDPMPANAQNQSKNFQKVKKKFHFWSIFSKQNFFLGIGKFLSQALQIATNVSTIRRMSGHRHIADTLYTWGCDN